MSQMIPPRNPPTQAVKTMSLINMTVNNVKNSKTAISRSIIMVAISCTTSPNVMIALLQLMRDILLGYREILLPILLEDNISSYRQGIRVLLHVQALYYSFSKMKSSPIVTYNLAAFVISFKVGIRLPLISLHRRHDSTQLPAFLNPFERGNK